MSNNASREADRLSYAGPEIVDVGPVLEITTGRTTPVRDLQSDPMTYFDASKRGSPTDEVELGNDE
jgi:hypothetical protein